MRIAGFDGTWEGWRTTARALLEAAVPPDAVSWRARDDAQLALGDEDDARAADGRRARVPRAFVERGERVACHRDGARWALLYRVLWRLAGVEPHLLDDDADPDVHRLNALDAAVRREIHKLHAFVRFRAVLDPDGGERYVAWYEPAHPVLPLAAPFFARRFAGMRWAILTPGASAVWDGAQLLFAPGATRDAAPAGDPLETLWRTYYASVFNPARVKTRAMRAEMPKRYWANLPEAALIPDLLAEAPARVRAMRERAARDEARRHGARGEER
jgi:DNA polymerase